MANLKPTFCVISSKHYFASVVFYFVLFAPNSVEGQISQLLELANNMGIGSVLQAPSSPNTYRHALDSETSLAWAVNRSNRTITFTIESSRSGYIALALTKRGILEGGDVVVVGAGENGTPYVLDMYGVNNDTIAEDDIQDWNLVSTAAPSAESGLRITIQRILDTCTDQDMPIEEEQIVVLYAYGSGSNITSDFESEGEHKIYFVDPYILPQSSNVNVSEFQQFRLSRRYEMPPRPTSYWCSIQNMEPTISTRHHIVGFNVYLPDDLAKRHVHHTIVYRCTAPPGANPEQLFEPFLDYPGEECYVNLAPRLPSAYCRELVHVSAVGGEPVIFPESLGLNLDGPSYFMFETHYDNPNRTAGITIENGVDFYYTSEIRPDSGSIILVGQGALGTFVIPPRTSNFNIAGHCSKECSTRITPIDGMDIVGLAFHGHTSTRKMRLRHFRGVNELPWILEDSEYDFLYQQVRLLETQRKIMPGDQLTVECEFDTNWKNGSAVASGFSTGDEMCMVFLLVNKPLPVFFCSSEYNTSRTMERFGIRNMTWDLNIHERVINDAVDPSIIGLTLSQVVERENWTPQRTQQLEREQMYSDHVANCPNVRLLGGVNFYLGRFENFTDGDFGLSTLDQATPKASSISSPFPTRIPVAYPLNGMTYNPPPSVCPWQMQSESNNRTNILPTQTQVINNDIVDMSRWVQRGNLGDVTNIS